MATIGTDFIKTIKKYEGGLTSDPKDPASKNPSPCAPLKNRLPPHTNKGVTWATFVALAPKLQYTADCPTFLSMPDEAWIKIFKQGYWDKLDLDNVNSNGVAYLLADFTWGSGEGWTKPFLTKFLSTNYGVTANDNASRNKALNDLTAKNENDVIQKLSADRLVSLKGFQGGKLFAEYGTGWTNRLNSLTSLAVSTIGQKISEAIEVVKKNPLPTILITSAVLVSIYFLVFSGGKSPQVQTS